MQIIGRCVDHKWFKAFGPGFRQTTLTQTNAKINNKTAHNLAVFREVYPHP